MLKMARIERMLEKHRKIVEGLEKETNEAYAQRRVDELKITGDMKNV